MLPKRAIAVTAIAALVLLAGQCGKEEGPTQTPTTIIDPIDTIPPAAISNLQARNPGVYSINLIWTAPGDDGLEGTAESYDIRYSVEQITDLSWDDALQYEGEPSPKIAGMPEAVTISGLDEISTYFFAVKTTDEAGNTSGLSNSASQTTLNEATPPMAVVDLSAVSISEYSFQLTWTAPGDDGIVGTASEYDIRFSMDPITPESWATATRVKQPPAPKSPGEPESLVVSQMRSQLNYYFAMMTADEVPNWSEMSNVAFGMGYSVQLMVSSHHVQSGEVLRILFRAPGEQTVWINLNQYAIMGCDPLNTFVKDNLIWGEPYPEGIHEIYYDFKKNGAYLPPATYYVVLCWNLEFQTSSVVYFDEAR
jgi:hypothetical protein